MSLKDQKATVSNLGEHLGLDEEHVEKLAGRAARLGLVRKDGSALKLTDAGRGVIRVVMCGGVFDIIHPGHVYTLSESSRLGDVLVVSVARDSTVLKMKGKKPINNEVLRAGLVGALRVVDVAVLGSEKDIYETVERVRPNVITLGYDQKHDERRIIAESEKRGVEVSVVRLDSPLPEIKSSTIKEERNVFRSF